MNFQLLTPVQIARPCPDLQRSNIGPFVFENEQSETYEVMIIVSVSDGDEDEEEKQISGAMTASYYFMRL
jgi:hypothetical protein